MNSMVERVAKAINPGAWNGRNDLMGLYKSLREESLRQARAAIAAMREPSADILNAADAWGDVDGYHRIVDAALKP